MRYRGVMFDLDGTLLDTLDDLAAAGNHAIGRLGRPAIETDRYRYLVGQGVRSLITDALGDGDSDEIDRGIELFKAYYTEHQFDRTRPYDGVAEMLETLHQRTLTLAILSNKPDAATQTTVSRLLRAERFSAIVGARDGVPLKPDPAAALKIVARLDIAADAWVYVGDTAVDMQTGTSAGFFTVGVTWGFRPEQELRGQGADAIIHRPSEMLALL